MIQLPAPLAILAWMAVVAIGLCLVAIPVVLVWWARINRRRQAQIDRMRGKVDEPVRPRRGRFDVPPPRPAGSPPPSRPTR